ncbi:MAG: rhomboid family intramembrane serine protease [Cyclobacteriaceae bacterium]|nr:rhomboid family intramembrane serine protease [Cyclobacteriaceae bacterium]
MDLTLILLVITGLISYKGFSDPALIRKLIMNPYQLERSKEWYRLLTSGFIHADWMHLLFNMFTFYFFGSLIERFFIQMHGLVAGSLYFLLLYLGGIIVSSIPSYLRHRKNPAYSSLGASGGVSAIVLASVLFFPLQDICLYGIICLPGFILGALFLGYSYYMSKNQYDRINHEAHLTGAVFGILISFLMRPDVFAHFFGQVFSWFGSF